MSAQNLAVAVIIAAAALASMAPAPATACGTVKTFAGIYLGAEQAFPDKNIRQNCQLQMLGSLLCVGSAYLQQPHAKRLLRAALAHAENSGNPTLKCAGSQVARYFAVRPAEKPDTGKPPLAELIKAETRVLSFCQPEKLSSDVETIANLPGPAHALRECLTK